MAKPVKGASGLAQRLLAASTITNAAMLGDSDFFNTQISFPLDMPLLSIACSGELNGGFCPGVTQIAGPSKHFKTALGLFFIRAFLASDPSAVVLFYDSEYGSTPAYWASFGIDTSRVIHCPVLHVEQLKFDLVRQLEEIGEKDRVMIFIDSIGNMASKKEVEDAMNQKSVADMTRAKAFKSVFRIATPHFVQKNIPCVVINHTYKSQDFFPVDVVGGGTGAMYASNTVFIISRAKEKDGDEQVGYIFTLKVEKSRFVREGSKLPLVVRFDTGIDRYSGMLEIAEELGFVKKEKEGKSNVFKRLLCSGNAMEWEAVGFREKDTQSPKFWDDMLKEESFQRAIEHRFKLSSNDNQIVSGWGILNEETGEVEAV